MKDKRLHINTPQEIAAAWESGKPLAALCGYIRVMDRDRHDKRVKSDEPETCADCGRIAAALVSTGQSTGLGPLMTSEQIQKRVAREKGSASASSGNYTYSIRTTTPATWTYK